MIQSFLDNPQRLNRQEKEEFLNSSYLNVPWRTFITLHQNHAAEKGLKSDFNNEALKLLVENAGDWNDCLPYGPESFSKLSPQEQEDLNEHLGLIWRVIEHYHFRTASLWGD